MTLTEKSAELSDGIEGGEEEMAVGMDDRTMPTAVPGGLNINC